MVIDWIVAAEQTKNFLSSCFSPFGGGAGGGPKKMEGKFFVGSPLTPRRKAKMKERKFLVCSAAST